MNASACPEETRVTRPPVRLFAMATAVIVLSLWLAQPLVGMIGHSLGLSGGAASLVTTLTLLGYATGLFALVPLGDRLENRRLILLTLGADVVCLLAAASPLPVPAFLVACLLVGLTATSIQMLVPMAAAMTPEAERGRVIGNIMSGLILGVMLSRPLASLIAGHFGWRACYLALAVAVALLAFALARVLPLRYPPQRTPYPALLKSMAGLLRDEPVLRRHALSAALSFAAFNAFWSLIALRLAAPPFRLGADGMALFALIGVSGAVSAPLAGRLADRGYGRRVSFAAHAAVASSSVLVWLGGSLIAPHGRLPALLVLGVGAILLDAGAIADQALGRRAVNLLRPEARSRINGLFTGLFFVGGSLGSAVAGAAWARLGWNGVSATALGFAAASAMAALHRERRAARCLATA